MRRWVARAPVGLPLRAALLGRSAAPAHHRARLREVLAPHPGERVLEVGPGTGYYTLDIADALSPGGQLDILDLQQPMLDHTPRRARERGLTNVVACRGDARSLAYEDNSFDAAYLAAVLGEIPDVDAARRELARVLKPGGRLVVGELFGDPHGVSPNRLRQRAEAAGLTFVERSGPPLGYFAGFTRP